MCISPLSDLSKCSPRPRLTNGRSEDRPAHGGKAPQTNHDPTILWSPHVRQTSTPCRKRWAADKAREEAQRKERAEILAEGGGDLERDEYGQARDVHGRAAELGDLRQWGEEHGPDPVSEDEKREAERRGDVRDAKLLRDEVGSRGVDRGADIDGEGEEADVERDETAFREAPLRGERAVSCTVFAYLKLDAKFLFKVCCERRRAQHTRTCNVVGHPSAVVDAYTDNRLSQPAMLSFSRRQRRTGSSLASLRRAHQWGLSFCIGSALHRQRAGVRIWASPYRPTVPGWISSAFASRSASLLERGCCLRSPLV